MSVKETVDLNDGNKMPMIGCGSWQLQKEQIYDTLLNAIKLGYRLIDCAELYGNEQYIGDALKLLFQQNIIERESLFITSKIWATHQYPNMVIPTLHKQLKMLNVDYFDLYLIHGPIAYYNSGKNENNFFPTDPKTNKRLYPTENISFLDTWKEMEKAVQLGLVKSIGVSNFNENQIQRILTMCSIKPTVNQCECHPYIYLQQVKLIEYCRSKNIVFQGYSPFGCAEKDGPLFDKNIKALSQKHKKSVAQILIKFCVQNNIPTVPKSAQFQHLKENMEIYNFNIMQKDIHMLINLSKNWRYVWNEADKSHKEYPFFQMTSKL